MAVGTHNEIHDWLFVPVGDQGVAIPKDHKTMEKHTDCVHALLTVNTCFAKYLISASSDKTVVLWELASSAGGLWKQELLVLGRKVPQYHHCMGP
jgi:hypothetical protein